MELSRRYLAELRSLRTQDQLTAWLASSLHTLMNQVSDVADSKHSASITKAITYMKQKYALNPTLEEVSEYAGYSPAYFSRIFKEDTGMTFSEFLNEIRIEKSKSLLLTSGLTIAQISTMLGYNDQSYFCRIFKNVTGTTPDRYRKRSRRLETE
jgi:YesN/AraC family two-component response regulator